MRQAFPPSISDCFATAAVLPIFQPDWSGIVTANALPLCDQHRYLAVHLPLLSTDRIQQHALPEPATPLALVTRHRGAVVLAAVDSGAATAGLVPGMTLADARAQLPQLAVEPDNPAADHALLEWLADGCDRYTPSVMAVPPRVMSRQSLSFSLKEKSRAFTTFHSVRRCRHWPVRLRPARVRISATATPTDARPLRRGSG